MCSITRTYIHVHTVLPRVNAHLISLRNVRLFEVLIVNFIYFYNRRPALPQILAHVFTATRSRVQILAASLVWKQQLLESLHSSI